MRNENVNLVRATDREKEGRKEVRDERDRKRSDVMFRS